MKPRKLSSGSWNVQVYDRYTGRLHSVTRRTQREAMADAMALKLSLEQAAEPDMSDMYFIDAYQMYIEDRSATLSPSTLRTYIGMRQYFKPIENKRLGEIRSEDLQALINKLARNHSPKTCRNIYGLITAIFRATCPERAFRVTMPKKIRTTTDIPDLPHLRAILANAEGGELYIPICLAAFCGLRRSEVCALRVEDIEAGTLHVHRALVRGTQNEWIEKAPKSYAGDRYVPLPQFLEDLIRQQGYVTDMNPNVLTLRFSRFLKDCDLPHYKFHALRHLYASMQHSLSIPTAYTKKSGGWSSDALERIYTHVITDAERQNTRKWLEYVEEIH